MFQSIIRLLFALFLILTSVNFLGCQEAETGEEELPFLIPEGKADNFIGTDALEYLLEGETTITLEDSLANATEDQKMARVKELIPLKDIVIGWFLNVYFVEKESKNKNNGYGGFPALVLDGSYEELNIRAVDQKTYSYTIRLQIGGSKELISELPVTTKNGRQVFTLKMGKISNDEMARLEINHEWYRQAPWDDEIFNPETLSAEQIETMDLAISPLENSKNSWINFDKLIADGKVTIDVYFGWDYHSNYHLKHSEELYKWLVTKGFKSPVASYDSYTRKSGAFTKVIKANGQQVSVQVRIIWGKTGTDTDPDTEAGGKVLENEMRASFKSSEVIIFSGHSGPFYGFALANWKVTDEGDLDDSEVASLDMPKDLYQLVVAEGCDTYGLGESFADNPNKPNYQNLDVITTTAPSNATSPEVVKTFIQLFLNKDENGDHKAMTYTELLEKLNSNSYWFHTMYGVHGTDDNPRMHPYAKAADLCRPCKTKYDCNQGFGMQCTRLDSKSRSGACTAECTDNSGCPNGYICQRTATGNTLNTFQCIPKNKICSSPDDQEEPPVTSGGGVIINEILADPAADKNGDANGDGETDATEDEFVEIVNTSNQPIDISNWKINDKTMTRFTFPTGTKLFPREVAVVFGGGDGSKVAQATGAKVFIASKTLGLNNTGDEVTLSDKDNKKVDAVAFGKEGGKDKSLVREIDGDPKAKFIVSKDPKPTPGLKSDGSKF